MTTPTEIIKVLPLTCHGHSRPVTHIHISSMLDDEQYYLMSACKDNNPMLRDGLTGDWIGTFLGHKGAVWQSRLSSDATLAATGSADFTAKVWDTNTGEALHTLQHNHIVRAIAFPPQKRPQILATAGFEKKLRVYDLSQSTSATDSTNDANSQAISAPSFEIGAGVHGGTIRSVVWTPDPSVLVTACEDKVIRWWDMRARAAIGSFTLDGPLGTCEMDSIGLNDGEATLSVAAGKNVYFFESNRPAALVKKVETKYEIASVAINGRAKKFVTGSPNDTWVRVWDLETGTETEVGKGHHGPIWACSFSPDGKLYATGSEDGTIKLWKFTTGPYGLWR